MLRAAPAVVITLSLSAIWGFGADLTVFGPQTYTRTTGKPVTVRNTFLVQDVSAAYTLRLDNHGVTAGTIVLNGQVVLKAGDLKDAHDTVLPHLVRPIAPRPGANEIAVELQGAPGTSLTLTIVGAVADSSPPTISALATPGANASGWNRAPVTVTFTCSDAGSGIATCPLPKVVSSEGAKQVISGTALDQAGNTATASVTVNIDLTPPVVTAGRSPAPNPNGWSNAPVMVSFAATDGLSGVAPGTLTSLVTLTADGANLSASGQATDLAGNVGTTTLTGIKIDRASPLITVALAPAPGADGSYTTPVTAHFTCSDAGSGVASCPPDQVVSTDGTGLTVTGTTVDLAGNAASVTSPPFTINLSGPGIAVSLSPPANASGWNNSPVTAHFTCSGTGPLSCPADQTVDFDGVQTIEGTVVDGTGRTATATAVVRLDRGSPLFTFGSPADGARLFTAAITVTGVATDALSGVAGATCGGSPAALSGSIVSCPVTLLLGANSVAIAVVDRAGNTGASTLHLTYTRVPTVTLTSPASLSYLNISPTTVTGTVDDPTATVVVNSVAAPVVNGAFSIPLPLAEGPNIVTATATATTGAVGTASLTVTLDTTPPHVTITSPPDGFITAESTISVAGNINDIVVGTVNAEQAQVSINGVQAQVGNRTFLATTVPLAIGTNVIQAVGKDRVGNAATTEITVVRQSLTNAQIHLIAGNNQTGEIGSPVGAPLVVSLTDATGAPVAGKPVIFKVTQNDGLLAGGAAPAPTAIVPTDGTGRAQARWTLGARAGAGGNVVEAYSVGFEGTSIFTATGTQGPAGKIVVDTGNDQIGAIGQALPKPFIAVVVDEGNNRLRDVPVTFTVQQGGGSFDGQPSVTVNSDSDGRVAVTLMLGQQEGNANNVVSAALPSSAGFPAAFTASGRAPGDPAKTAISGVVLDNANAPVAGVTVRALLADVLHSNLAAVPTAIAAQTDAQGQFRLTPAPVGIVKLMVDGTTTTRPGTYPSLEYDMVTVAGQTNTVGQPMYLLPLTDTNKLCVTATTGGGTLTMADAPGFSLTFGPGQVTFPGGSKSGCVSVTSVHGDKVPMVPGFGQQPRFIVTIQPSGAVFNPPAPITLPNVDGLKPRAVTEMYSYDHDISSFVAIGTGVVSDDGLVIRSSAGVGVLKAGWHCGGDPAAVGTTADCAVCSYCVGVSPPGTPASATPGTCVPDPGQANKPCSGGSECQLPSRCGVDASLGFNRPTGQCIPDLNALDDTPCSLGVCQGGRCAVQSCSGESSGAFCVISGGGLGTCDSNGGCQSCDGECPTPPQCPTGTTFSASTNRCCDPAGHCTPAIAISQDKDLWYFNGEPTPVSFTSGSTIATLVATGADRGLFMWEVIAGSDRVSFQNGSAIVMNTDSNSVKIVSKKMSSPRPAPVGDVVIRLTHNGATTVEHRLDVRSPYKLVPRIIDPTTGASFIDGGRGATCDLAGTEGYLSVISYEIRNQFGELVRGAGINEKLGIAERGSEYPINNWNGAQSGHDDAADGVVADNVCITGVRQPLDWAPRPLAPPAHPDDSVEPVVKIPQQWYVGSTISGRGVLVQTNEIWMYIDHGRHKDIRSPVR